MTLPKNIKNNNKVAMDKAIVDFQELFYQNFNVIVIARYDIASISFRVPLSKLEGAANTLINHEILNGTYPEGVKTKSRKSDIVQLRGCIFKIARDMGYSLHKIGGYFGFNHATVISITKKINNLESIGDITILTLLKTIEDGCQDKPRNDTNIKSDN